MQQGKCSKKKTIQTQEIILYMYIYIRFELKLCLWKAFICSSTKEWSNMKWIFIGLWIKPTSLHRSCLILDQIEQSWFWWLFICNRIKTMDQMEGSNVWWWLAQVKLNNIYAYSIASSTVRWCYFKTLQMINGYGVYISAHAVNHR